MFGKLEKQSANSSFSFYRNSSTVEEDLSLLILYLNKRDVLMNVNTAMLKGGIVNTIQSKEELSACYKIPSPIAANGIYSTPRGSRS
jgi:hypothetical protein